MLKDQLFFCKKKKNKKQSMYLLIYEILLES